MRLNELVRVYMEEAVLKVNVVRLSKLALCRGLKLVMLLPSAIKYAKPRQI